MANKNYMAEVYDTSNKRQKVTISAASVEEAKKTLRARGMRVVPSSVKLEKKKGEIQLPWEGKLKMKLEDTAAFARQLHQMLDAGLPPQKGLLALVEDEEDKAKAAMYADIAGQITEGKPYAEAFGAYPEIFTEVFCAYLEAGQASGDMAGATERLAELLEQRAHIQSKVKGALTYPKMSAGAIVMLAGVMLGFVVPKFASVYASMNAKLPAITQSLVNISHHMLPIGLKFPFVHPFAYPMFLVYLGLIVRALVKKYKPQVEIWWKVNRILFKVPIFGKLSKSLALYRWTSTLSGGLSAELSLPKALELAGRAAGSEWISFITPSLVDTVKSGKPLSAGLAQHPELFSGTMRATIRSAEDSGDITPTLDANCRAMSRNVDGIVEGLSAQIEVVMTLGLGGVVGVLMLALYMPIFSMGDAIDGTSSTSTDGSSGSGTS